LDGPTVGVKHFIHRSPGIQAPAICSPTPLPWLMFQADAARRAHRRGRVTGASRIIDRYRLADRYWTKWSEHL